MTAYELMRNTNLYLVKGGALTDEQKLHIANGLLITKSTSDEAKRFYIGVRFPGNIDFSGRRMYPEFFIPPYNDGKKYKTVLGQTTKTHIFSANMYELEILRLLYILKPDDPQIKNMVMKTLLRLKTTCFGNEDDGVGECFDTSIVVLRFLAATVPDDTNWIQSRIDNYNRHFGDKKRPWFSKWYFWLCLSELPFDIAKPEIKKYKPEMLNWLTNKSCVMNGDFDKTVHPVLICILRNIISKYPEYEYIKNHQPYVSDKDGRLHFDMEVAD